MGRGPDTKIVVATVQGVAYSFDQVPEVPLQCLRLLQLGVVNPRVNHNSCNPLIVLQDHGYLCRNIENTSTRETVSVQFTFSSHSTDEPDDGVSDDHSVTFCFVERSEAVAGGDLEDRRRRRGRGHRPGPGSHLSLLHPGSVIFRHRIEGHLGRLRPGCMGPVQRNTRSRGGGGVSSALHTYPGLVSVSPRCSPLP